MVDNDGINSRGNQCPMSYSAKSKSICRCFGWCVLCLLTVATTFAQSKWDQPSAQLAGQIAAILGAGQAQLEIVNRSAIASTDLPQIRRAFEQALRAHSIATSGTDRASANQIRITLSENARERLWVAEVIEGNLTQVTMVPLNREAPAATPTETGLVLERKPIWSSTDSGVSITSSHEPVLAALETESDLVLLKQGELIVLTKSTSGWQEVAHIGLNRRPLSRDARGILIPASNGHGFIAFAAGTSCAGSLGPSADASSTSVEWTIHCHESDDPWPAAAGEKAFYNASRNFSTGVITPSPGLDLGPFYSIAAVPRTADRVALLVNGIDGKVQLADGNTLKTVSGTRDWGSDFAALHSNCGSGIQIVASSSGEAQQDSLRAYELPAQEAIPVSPALEMGGTVTALWTAPNRNGVLAIVRKNANEFEVDRVTALCP